MAERSSRGIFLDPDMYKISEEDSQDEEVLSTMASLKHHHHHQHHKISKNYKELLPQKYSQLMDMNEDKEKKVFQLIHEVEDEESEENLKSVSVTISYCSLSKSVNSGGGGTTGGSDVSSLCELVLGIIPGTCNLASTSSSGSKSSSAQSQVATFLAGSSVESGSAIPSASGSYFPPNSGSSFIGGPAKKTKGFAPVGSDGGSSLKAKGAKLFKFTSSQQSPPSLGQASPVKSVWDLGAMDKWAATGTTDDRLIVAGFIPDGPTMKNKHIKVGDCIESINGIPVIYSNVDLVLSSILEVETQFLPQSDNILSFEPRYASLIRDLKIKVQLKVRHGLPGIERRQSFGGDSKRLSGVNDFSSNRGQSGNREKRKNSVEQETTPGRQGHDVDTEGDESGKRVPLTSMSSICNQIPDAFLQSLAIIFISSASSTSPNNINTQQHRSHLRKSSKANSNTAQEDENSNPKDSRIDAVFSWPNKSKSRIVGPLVSSHGMFSTLYKLLKDVTASHPLLSRVRIDGEMTDIAYESDTDVDGLLLVAIAVGDGSTSNIKSRNSDNTVPGSSTPGRERITPSSLCRFTRRLVKSLVFKWGSLTRAFLRTKEKEMGRFLSNATACLIDTCPEDFLFMSQPTTFPFIPNKIRLSIEEILFTLEGSDFYEEFDQLPKASQDTAVHFHCLGSILFFKRQLVVSHFRKSLQSQFYSWMMTELNKWGEEATWTRLKRLVLWQPAYIASPGSPSKEMGPRDACHYAVLVGLDYFLLGFILEPVTTCQRFARPDTLWIRRGVQSLIQLVRSDVNHFFQIGVHQVPDRIEVLRSSSGRPSSPPLKKSSRGDNSNKSGGNINLSDNAGQGSHNVPNVNVSRSFNFNFEENSNTQYEHQPPYNSPTSGAVPPSMLTSSATSPAPSSFRHSSGPSIQSLIEEFDASHLVDGGGSTSTDRYDGSGGGGVGGSDASSSKLSGDGSETTSTDRPYSYVDGSRESLSTVSICKGNHVYEFIQVEYGRGLLISTEKDPMSAYVEILSNFRRHSSLSHEILHNAAKARKKLGNREADWKWVSKPLTPITEHGSLFECQIQEYIGTKKKKKCRKHCYWVIGRLYEDEREIYICLQDTLEHHNVLELAFKIAHVTGPGSNVITMTNPQYVY